MVLRRRSLPLLVLVVATTCAAASAHAFTIMLEDASMLSRLRTQADGALVPTGAQLNPTTDDLPLSETLSDFNGNSSASAAYSLSQTGFSMDVTHTVGLELHDRAWSITELYFRSDEDLNYTVESVYDIVRLNKGNAITWVYIEEIHPDADPSNVYRASKRKDVNSLESFSLEPLPNFPPIERLYAGHLYRVRMSSQIMRSEDIWLDPFPLITTASGTSTVTFSQAPVPEPGTAVLVAIGLAGFGFRRTR